MFRLFARSLARSCILLHLYWYSLLYRLHVCARRRRVANDQAVGFARSWFGRHGNLSHQTVLDVGHLGILVRVPSRVSIFVCVCARVATRFPAPLFFLLTLAADFGVCFTIPQTAPLANAAQVFTTIASVVLRRSPGCHTLRLRATPLLPTLTSMDCTKNACTRSCTTIPLEISSTCRHRYPTKLVAPGTISTV
jgi:hypothetical protein